MAVSLSNYLGIDSVVYFDTGAFDPILDLDTRLFIDPHLLKHTEVPELLNSYEELQKHFRIIGKLLLNADGKTSRFWRKADSLMKWPEVKGLCIGYSKGGTAGSGIGPELRLRLLTVAKQIIDKGRSDPELFELVGLFEDDFGADRISDMTANIIRDDLAAYTIRILSDYDIEVAEKFAMNELTGRPINPFNGQDICLVPRELLRDLPVALDWSSRDEIAKENAALREKLNAIIGTTWKQAMSMGKKTLKETVLENIELIDDLIEQYCKKGASHYDFALDKAGQYLWYPATKRITSDHPLVLTLSDTPTIDEVEQMVLAICDKFKGLVENNGLNKLLYDGGMPKHEEAAQLVFFGVAESYCHANNIMIARESNSGRGPVDFKFGSNMENSVLVEIKKSTNTSGLAKGIANQLPEYMKSEKSKRAIYLVIDVGHTEASLKRLNELNKKVSGSAIKLIHVNGNLQVSASKL